MSWHSYCKVSLSIFRVPFVIPSSYMRWVAMFWRPSIMPKVKVFHWKLLHPSMPPNIRLACGIRNLREKRYALFIMLSSNSLIIYCLDALFHWLSSPYVRNVLGLRFNFFSLVARWFFIVGFFLLLVKSIYCYNFTGFLESLKWHHF